MNHGHKLFIMQPLQIGWMDMPLVWFKMEEILLDTLEPVNHFKTIIDGMKSPTIDKTSKPTTKQTFEFFDEFKVFLNENIGMVSKRPVGCVIQKLVQVPEHDT